MDIVSTELDLAESSADHGLQSADTIAEGEQALEPRRLGSLKTWRQNW